MKLVLSIIHDEDAYRVMEKLNSKGFSNTKLCSSGGFLRAGNTTLLCGVKDEDLDSVIEIIKGESQSRKKATNKNTQAGTKLPKEVVVGGATVFVMDVERFEKL
ncbi:MAG: cyclic-di-AMP receptor [Clostridiales bacterium]|nr:cyclic-di-AMP receptor [Clostridiales bacterium]HBM79405.1 hypothetical protein [Clostridiaceae bacterium]